jgi:maltooligosyltrehalose synthase
MPFTLLDALRLCRPRYPDNSCAAPCLADLGISDIYASPILQATPGSTHGYDVTNPDRLNPEPDTWDDFQALTAARQARGMGWLQDIVPNYMAHARESRTLMDVFENGPRSATASTSCARRLSAPCLSQRTNTKAFRSVCATA